MNKLFRPMLAGKADFFSLRFPVFASVKIDGLRCTVRNGQPMSRSQKVLPNRFLRDWVARNAPFIEGLDGEVVVGPINAPDCYRASASGIMSEDGEPDFTFHVFDTIQGPTNSYKIRYANIVGDHDNDFALDRIVVLQQHLITDMAQLDAFEAKALDEGHEGIMTRDPHSFYKEGRATSKGQELLKIKRFEDAEATVTGVEEEMHNGNEAQTNEIGRTKRSSHQENKTGKGVLGALVVTGLTAYPGIEFRIGTGFDAATRASLWQDNSILGKIVRFKHFPVGAKDAPRHPVFLGFRDERDMGEDAA
jgi:DNA ligase-1